nr:LacI family DNA-binding transcriptional regulator [Flexivirga oryzae]
MSDVAARAGVSLATASRALNGSERVVRPELRERVRAAAERLGYTANQQAQAVARGATRTVGVVLGDIADPYFAAVAAGITEAAGERQLVVTMASVGVEVDRVVDSLSVLRGGRPRAVLMTVSRHTDPAADGRMATELDRVRAYGGGVAFLGDAPDGFVGVPVAHRANAGALAEQLLGLGYRDTAVLAGPAELLTAAERAIGFLTGMEKAGCPVPPARQLAGALSRDGGFDAMTRLLASGTRPELVFAVTDVMAVGAMAAIRSAGLEPGRDIAVAGYDDIEMLQDVTPGLTTVSLPLRDIGRRLLDVALDDDTGGATEPVRGTVVLRDSTPRRRA